MRIKQAISLVALVIACSFAVQEDEITFEGIDMSKIQFIGRWEDRTSKENGLTFGNGEFISDWPCSAIKFNVELDNQDSTVKIKWYGVRERVQLTVTEIGGKDAIFEDVLVGRDFASGIHQSYKIDFSKHAHTSNQLTVTLTKMTQANPLSTGIATKFFHPSTFSFSGLKLDGKLLDPPQKAPHRIQFLGASDTAGYCIDGTPDTSAVSSALSGWEYTNCDAGYVHLVGEALDADIEVLAIAGIGLTQNANAKQKWQLGPLPLPDYYNRTLQSDADTMWDPENFVPDLVVISLGGNDYNH